MEISKVTLNDISGIKELQDKLILDRKGGDTDGGFLVSAFTVEQYRHFSESCEYFFKVTDGEELSGVIMAYNSENIAPDDKNNMLLKSVINKDFVIIKQVFVSPDHAGRGVASMLYRHLMELVKGQRPVAAVVVVDPFNLPSVKFHKKMGFREFLVFLPDADRDGMVRKRSAWIMPSAKAEDFRDEIRFENSSEKRNDDMSEAIMCRMNDLVTLYTHEDNLNWTKLSNQFVVLFAMFGAFAFLYFRDEPPVGLFSWLMILIAAVGLVVNVMFIFKIVSGISYMNTYKKKLRNFDKAVTFRYPEINTIMNDNDRISRKSRTCNLLLFVSILATISWFLASFELVRKVFCG